MKKLLLLLLFPMAMNAQVVGTWKLANQAGALGVGPALGDISWWSNSVGDLTTRACLFDDSITFNANGSMMHYMDGQTWLEGWQGAVPDACGTPVAPHNGANPSMTYAYDGVNNTLTVFGLGAHMGLAKVINGAEINNPANASDTIVYMATISNGGNTMTLDINFGPGYWRFVYNRTQMIPVANYNVTFRVDMAQYTGAGNLANGVFINGSFNGWCGNCNPMTNTSGSLWEVTLPLNPGAIEYKFTIDGWNDQENFTGTELCIDPVNDGFNNRYHVVANDVTLPAVCFGSCDVCTNATTFQVNMNDWVAGGGSTAPGVFLNGTFNGWCGTCTPMTDANMDGIWDVTVPLAVGNIEYKFTVDGWATSEQFAGGEPCTITSGGFTNRAASITTAGTLPVVCWESCTDCPASVDELNEGGIVISPNPATDVINVSAKANINTIAVYDLNGRVVASFEVNAASTAINVSEMTKGLYLVAINTAKGTYTERVIVK